MQISSVDKIIEHKIFENRICKIKYSYAFEVFLHNRLSILRKRYNVYSIGEIFTDNNGSVTNDSKLKSWITSMIKNLLGLIPNYGAIITVALSITDTISFLKISDCKKIREHLQIKERPHKKYKKIKNILLIENSSYLTAEETKKLRLLKELIERKYIVNTVLVICEPLDFYSSLDVSQDTTYTISLDNSLQNELWGRCLNENELKLVNVLGIEYAEYIRNLEHNNQLNSDLLLQKLLEDMLNKIECNNSENLFEFLRLCSLLFDVFSDEDVEKISEIKKTDNKKEFEESILAGILEQNIIPNEYKFFLTSVRKYYQKRAQFYSSEIKSQILCYLKNRYPTKYMDLALASIVTNTNKEDTISLCLKALYYDKNHSIEYKKNEVITYLSKIGYPTLNSILYLNDVYISYDFTKLDIKNLCMQSLFGLEEMDYLSLEDRLICLSSISKVSYEVMPQEFLNKIDSIYRKTLRDIKISTTYKKYSHFIFDYLVFSTCIEDSYECKEVAQRLVKYLNKTTLSLDMKIKFSRLGNAIFYNDYDKGLELTRQAYCLCDGYPIEKKYATINYSCSLGLCGNYEDAKKILYKEFRNSLWESNAISLSATNNFLIVSYLNDSKDINWLRKNLFFLFQKVKHTLYSDRQIIFNNFLASLVEENDISNHAKIQNLTEDIYSYEEDVYHLFFTHHNMMIYYFLNKDFHSFMKEKTLCSIPGLLSPYKIFFVEKANFLQENFDCNWDIPQLNNQLINWGKCYPEKKYSLYKKPILYGFIERWFE